MSGQANKPMSQPAHSLTCEELTTEMNASPEDGLTAQEAQKRLEEYGRNELDEGPGVQPFKILLRQVANAMMLVKSPNSCVKNTFFLTFSVGARYGHGGILRN